MKTKVSNPGTKKQVKTVNLLTQARKNTKELQKSIEVTEKKPREKTAEQKSNALYKETNLSLSAVYKHLTQDKLWQTETKKAHLSEFIQNCTFKQFVEAYKKGARNPEKMVFNTPQAVFNALSKALSTK